MLNADIEAKSDTQFSIFMAVGFSCLVGFMAFELRKSIFHWKGFNPSGIDDIISLLFLGVCMISWWDVFDRRTMIKIGKEGICLRRYNFPLRKVHLVPWEKIYYFYVLQKTEKGVTSCCLIVGLSNDEKEEKAELNFLDHCRRPYWPSLKDTEKSTIFEIWVSKQNKQQASTHPIFASHKVKPCIHQNIA
jgi:hypothetical protein